MWFLSPCVALAGQIVVDSTVPVDVFHGDTAVARLFVPGKVVFDLDGGHQALRLWVDGEPHDVSVDVPDKGSTTVVVAKTGITTNAAPTVDVAGDIGPVEFRVVGGDAVLVMIDDQRLRLGPGDTLRLDLKNGSHSLGVRNSEGTVVWASGTLDIDDPKGLVVQLAEGRMPKVGGTGGSFSPSGH